MPSYSHFHFGAVQLWIVHDLCCPFHRDLPCALCTLPRLRKHLGSLGGKAYEASTIDERLVPGQNLCNFSVLRLLVIEGGTWFIKDASGMTDMFCACSYVALPEG